jgi:hypothetical protein
MTRPEKDRAGTAEWVQAQIAAASPLTHEQAYRLRQLLGVIAQTRRARTDTVEGRSEAFGRSA